MFKRLQEKFNPPDTEPSEEITKPRSQSETPPVVQPETPTYNRLSDTLRTKKTPIKKLPKSQSSEAQKSPPMTNKNHLRGQRSTEDTTRWNILNTPLRKPSFRATTHLEPKQLEQALKAEGAAQQTGVRDRTQSTVTRSIGKAEFDSFELALLQLLNGITDLYESTKPYLSTKNEKEDRLTPSLIFFETFVSLKKKFQAKKSSDLSSDPSVSQIILHFGSLNNQAKSPEITKFESLKFLLTEFYQALYMKLLTKEISFKSITIIKEKFKKIGDSFLKVTGRVNAQLDALFLSGNEAASGPFLEQLRTISDFSTTLSALAKTTQRKLQAIEESALMDFLKEKEEIDRAIKASERQKEEAQARIIAAKDEEKLESTNQEGKAKWEKAEQAEKEYKEASQQNTPDLDKLAELKGVFNNTLREAINKQTETAIKKFQISQKIDAAENEIKDLDPKIIVLQTEKEAKIKKEQDERRTLFTSIAKAIHAITYGPNQTIQSLAAIRELVDTDQVFNTWIQTLIEFLQVNFIPKLRKEKREEKQKENEEIQKKGKKSKDVEFLKQTLIEPARKLLELNLFKPIRTAMDAGVEDPQIVLNFLNSAFDVAHNRQTTTNLQIYLNYLSIPVAYCEMITTNFNGPKWKSILIQLMKEHSYEEPRPNQESIMRNSLTEDFRGKLGLGSINEISELIGHVLIKFVQRIVQVPLLMEAIFKGKGLSNHLAGRRFYEAFKEGGPAQTSTKIYFPRIIVPGNWTEEKWKTPEVYAAWEELPQYPDWKPEEFKASFIPFEQIYSATATLGSLSGKQQYLLQILKKKELAQGIYDQANIHAHFNLLTKAAIRKAFIEYSQRKDADPSVVQQIKTSLFVQLKISLEKENGPTSSEQTSILQSERTNNDVDLLEKNSEKQNETSMPTEETKNGLTK